MPNKRNDLLPRVPYPDEKNHEQPDARDRETPPQEGPHAAGDEELQQIARLIKIARKYKELKYMDLSIFVRMCSRCRKPWGMHYGDGCCHWSKPPKFKHDKKLTELFNSIRALLGTSEDS